MRNPRSLFYYLFFSVLDLQLFRASELSAQTNVSEMISPSKVDLKIYSFQDIYNVEGSKEVTNDIDYYLPRWFSIGSGLGL
jgi:hypothetical protein